MSKDYVWVIIVTLVQLFALASLSNGQACRAVSKTWTVDDIGQADFRTIGDAVSAASSGDTILVQAGLYNENVLINKPLCLQGESPDTTKIDGGTTGSAILLRASHCAISGFTLKNAYGRSYCVHVDRCGYNRICGNIFHGGFFCLFLWHSSNNLLLGNRFSEVFDYGILLGSACNSNVISSNTVENTWYRIGLWGSSSNVLFNNTVKNTGRGSHPVKHFEPAGILLYDGSNDNRVTGNTLVNNDWNGIAVALYSTGNLIACNNISLNNYYGAWLGDNSTGNLLRHNYFRNQKQVYADQVSNAWDEGGEGNWWSDYNGTDVEGDGIGDTPYVINATNIDNHPLMAPWTPTMRRGDLNRDGNVDIIDLVMASASYGLRESQAGWNPHVDIAAPFGTITIQDLVTTCCSYGRSRR